MALENRDEEARRGPERRAVAVPEPYAAVLAGYTAALAQAPVAAQTRRTYASKVRQYLDGSLTPPSTVTR
ncbi:hypothetical protein [Frankia sp. CiP3]|uniref:hypothetical protein n=1 Tax=Frankia sp. CiP3 TaxID=2880971 RepID=UPI001EF4DE08|nr:hypothetical protein [Frankia sp. CiP3]